MVLWCGQSQWSLFHVINSSLLDILFNCLTPWAVHDDVIIWKHFPRHWPFVRSPVNSPHKGQWRGALAFSLICVWINDWVNNREAGDLRRYCAHYDVIVMCRWIAMINDTYMNHSGNESNNPWCVYVTFGQNKLTGITTSVVYINICITVTQQCYSLCNAEVLWWEMPSNWSQSGQ